MMKTYQEEIEFALHSAVPLTHFPENRLYEAARYALLGGGKRLRPLLTLLTAGIYGLTLKEAMPAACAVEMIHTYSLIHDDLPAMDNDDLRRGKPSLHKAFGEALAILAGDYLLTKAFELLANTEHFSTHTRLEMVKILSKYSGGWGMIGGQVLDLNLCLSNTTTEQLETTHYMKTGALIACAMLLGALGAQAPLEELPIIEKAGYSLGTAFQIQNDLLDVFSKGSDAENGKITAMKIYGQEQAQLRAHELYEKALNLLSQLSVPAQKLIEFCSNIDKLTKVRA